MANYYLKATGDWQTSGTWSATDGGAALVSGYPTTGDAVYFTANGNGLTCTISTTNACASITASGSTTATLAGAGILTVSGNVVFLASMTMSYTGAMSIGGNFTGGGLSYGAITLTGATSTVAGSNTFTTFNLTSTIAQTISFTDGSNTTATSFYLSGTAGYVHTISHTSATHFTLTATNASSLNYCALSYCTSSPANYIRLTVNSTGSNNTSVYTITRVILMRILTELGII
jgi:hypothetical protein